MGSHFTFLNSFYISNASLWKVSFCDRLLFLVSLFLSSYERLEDGTQYLHRTCEITDQSQRKREKEKEKIGRNDMSLGNDLLQARKKSGLSPEMVAEKLGVRRQTISNWETGETIPNLDHLKKLARLYQLPLDQIYSQLCQIEHVIETSDEKTDGKIDWTNAWGKKYPILVRYQSEVNIPKYAKEIRRLFHELQQEYHYNELEAMLVLKDILYHEWKDHK